MKVIIVIGKIQTKYNEVSINIDIKVFKTRNNFLKIFNELLFFLFFSEFNFNHLK